MQLRSHCMAEPPPYRDATATDDAHRAPTSAQSDTRMHGWLLWLEGLLQHAIAVRLRSSRSQTIDGDVAWSAAPSVVRQALRQAPCTPAFGLNGAPRLSMPGALPPRLLRYIDAFELDDFDVAVLLISAAADIDLRYEPLFAFLQDSEHARRPSVDLMLDLLCSSGAEKLARRSRFAPDAPLVRQRLVHLVDDPTRTACPLLAHGIIVDAQLLAAILGQESIDGRVAPACESLPLAQADRREVRPLRIGTLCDVAKHAFATRRSISVVLEATDADLHRRIGQHLAAAGGRPILRVAVDLLQSDASAFAENLDVACREAWLGGAVLYLDHCDDLDAERRATLTRVVLRPRRDPVALTVIATATPWFRDHHCPDELIHHRADADPIEWQRTCWREALRERGARSDESTILDLATRYHLSRRQIVGAVRDVIPVARSRPGGSRSPHRPAPRDLFSAARRQSRHVLADLAIRVDAARTWTDLIVPEDVSAQLRAICARYVHRQKVLDDWHFRRKMPYGTGINVLFTGPSGTGKTMAAEIIAGELALDLYRVELASVISKYIGETEKNLQQVFAAASDARAIILFDEADALFGKRSEVKDAHDRYANVETSYLLQKMEQYEGIAVLATNLRQNVDEAFLRRMAFVVHFPFPEESCRRRIWQSIWPDGLSLASDIDFDQLAREVKLSGGGIRNAALAAAYAAAANGATVTREHVVAACRREYQKAGKVWLQAQGELR